MRNLNYLYFVCLITVLSSCASLKLKNISDCDIDEKRVAQILKGNSYKIQEGVIRKVYSDSLSNSNCEGLFYVEVLKWKDIKTNLNYVSIPIIVTKDTVFMNVSYTNGNKKTNDNNIETELTEIENRFNMSFSKERLEVIKNKYRYGIEISPKGHFLK